MFPTKKGGGNKQELYDPENGQYTDEEKAKLLDDEISNMVMRYIFGLDNTFDPQFPIFGFHTDEYCELYVKHRICKLYRCLSYTKIEYLLTPISKNDKSNFFKLLGYELNDNDKNILYKEIIDGTDFTKRKFNKLNEFGLFIKAPTKLYNKNHTRFVYITTIWKYSKDEKLTFITAIPKVME